MTVDYVKFYKEKTGENFDCAFYEVHHIDGNRENNSFENLVMLPKELHRAYHVTKPSKNFNLTIEILSHADSGRRYNNFVLGVVRDFVLVWEDCSKWCDHRDYLVGKLPNLHRLDVIVGEER